MVVGFDFNFETIWLNFLSSVLWALNEMLIK